jgi:electron-transferring-flavoprotein dehydrogenase
VVYDIYLDEKRVDMEREEFEVDLLYVGGGISALSSAIYLMKLIEQHNKDVRSGKKYGSIVEKPTIAILEKGGYIGAHSLSGAIVDREPFFELFPEYMEEQFPIDGVVEREELYYLTRDRWLKIPFIPSELSNHSLCIISLARVVKWLGEVAESMDILLLPEFPGVQLLREDGRVIGVRCGDRGVASDGSPRSNFELGTDILTNMVVLAEGSRGTITKELIREDRLEGRFPQVYELGVREIWEVLEDMEGTIIHSIGYPFKFGEGGSFLYGMRNNMVTIGVVASLDNPDPRFDLHKKLQILKSHPIYKKILKNGKPLYYGAKTLNGGGYYTIPNMVGDGYLLIGESCGLVNPMRLKGVHLAMNSGMMAAKTIFKAMLAKDYSKKILEEYEINVRKFICDYELKGGRNFRGAMNKRGISAIVHIALQKMTGGSGVEDPIELVEDYKS